MAIIITNIVHPTKIDGKFKVVYVEKESTPGAVENGVYAKRWDEKIF